MRKFLNTLGVAIGFVVFGCALAQAGISPP